MIQVTLEVSPLINNLCKIFMGIMNKRLQTWCDEYKVIDESQAGFRKQYFTADNIFCLHAVASEYLTKPRGRFYCLFIDFAKALIPLSMKNCGMHCLGKG